LRDVRPISRDYAGKSADPNSELSTAEQGIKNAEQGIQNAHYRASSRITNGAVCNAIAAIFAAFKPTAPSRGRSISDCDADDIQN